MCSPDQRRNRVSEQRHRISPQATPRFLRATAPHPSLPCARASLSTRLRLSAERGSTIRPSPSPVRASQVLPFQPPPGREERPQNRKKANVRPKHHRRHRTSASAGEAGHGRPGGAGRQSERRGPASWMCSSVLERYTTGGLNRERDTLTLHFVRTCPLITRRLAPTQGVAPSPLPMAALLGP
jgi:hypothetical protein